MKKKQKKKTMRNNVKYAGMNPLVNLKTRAEEIQDIDYFHKLNDKEKAFMNAFIEEWVNANTKHKGKKLHKTRKERKIIYDRNNRRNRDAFTKTKTVNNLYYYENSDIKNFLEEPMDIEDELITKYDLSNADEETFKQMKKDYKKSE